MPESSRFALPGAVSLKEKPHLLGETLGIGVPIKGGAEPTETFAPVIDATAAVYVPQAHKKPLPATTTPIGVGKSTVMFAARDAGANAGAPG
jgi:hypothetical protein